MNKKQKVWDIADELHSISQEYGGLNFMVSSLEIEISAIKTFETYIEPDDQHQGIRNILSKHFPEELDNFTILNNTTAVQYYKSLLLSRNDLSLTEMYEWFETARTERVEQKLEKVEKELKQNREQRNKF